MTVQELERVSGLAEYPVYAVPKGALRGEIPARPGVRRVMSALEFEEAMNDVAVLAAYLPENAAMTRELLARICARCGQSKPVYWEIDPE